MRTPALFIAAAALLAGCSAAPEPSPTPDISDLTGAPLVTPSPDPVIPGTDLTVGPTPGTVLGEGGRVVRFVEAAPALSLECRSVTAGERSQMSLAPRRAEVDTSRPMRAVDLPEDGFAVVAYWGREDGGDLEAFAFVTGGGRFSDLYPGWRGSHTLAGVAFADGPKVLDAARECVGAQA